jgi:hypothetical protein
MPNSKFLPIAAVLTACLSILAHAKTLSITVTGIEDTARSTTLSVNNGAFTIFAPPVDSGHSERDTEVWDPNAPNPNDPEGEPGAWVPAVEEYGHWTQYRVDAPEAWTGQSVCFSLNGTQWSALYLVLEYPGDTPDGPALFEIDVESLGGNPFPSGTNPNTNITADGNVMRIGRWWNDAGRSVFNIHSWDNYSDSWPCVGMDIVASTDNAFWRWIHPGAVAMELDFRHRLSLSGRTTGKRIIIDPDGESITVNNRPLITSRNAVSQLSTNFVTKNHAGVNLGSNTNLPATSSPFGPQLVLGRFNNTTTDADGVNHSQGFMVVGSGTGTGANPRENGMRILYDGTVLIQPRGDLPMDFQNGPRP